MKPKTIVIIGEALVDQFPDGTSVIGGAPLNVAWHACGLERAQNANDQSTSEQSGFDSPLFVSSVGQDKFGNEIISEMKKWGMNVDHVQIHPTRPTGVVRVVLDNGQPSYTLVEDVAYDDITFRPELIEYLRSPASDNQSSRPLLYHGSLCFRSEATRQTILDLRKQLDADVFVDINIRDGNYEDTWVPTLLTGASYLKCNEHELARLTQQSVASHNAILTATRDLIQQYKLKACWITMGADGAFWIDHHGDHFFRETPKVPAADFKDTIGAGDAFTAVTLRGLACEQFPAEALDEAVQFAAKVCTLSGATTLDPRFYN